MDEIDIKDKLNAATKKNSEVIEDSLRIKTELFSIVLWHGSLLIGIGIGVLGGILGNFIYNFLVENSFLYWLCLLIVLISLFFLFLRANKSLKEWQWLYTENNKIYKQCIDLQKEIVIIEGEMVEKINDNKY